MVLSGRRHTLPQSRAHTSRGSATPDDSIRMWSHGTPRSRESFIRCPMPCRNSSAAVQQAQPFCSSTVSSGDDVPPVFLDTSAASMFISATSFTMRPTLIPALFSSRCFSSVVLPAPRKPESSVIGVVSGKSVFSPEPAIFVCPGPTAAAHASAGGTEGSREGARLPRAIQKLPACRPSKVSK